MSKAPPAIELQAAQQASKLQQANPQQHMFDEFNALEAGFPTLTIHQKLEAKIRQMEFELHSQHNREPMRYTIMMQDANLAALATQYTDDFSKMLDEATVRYEKHKPDIHDGEYFTYSDDDFHGASVWIQFDAGAIIIFTHAEYKAFTGFDKCECRLCMAN